MVHLSEIPKEARDNLVNEELPEYQDTLCVSGPPLRERRIAILTTAGLHRREDKVFTPGVGEYRIIPEDANMNELVMSHVSTNFDRSGYLKDFNVVFPIERLRELEKKGVIGSVAQYHFAFMGATPPTAHQAVSKDLAGILKKDQVDGVMLAGV